MLHNSNYYLFIDATPVTPQPSGVGLYTSNLVAFLNSLNAARNFNVNLVYQPGFKAWIRNKAKIPEYLTVYKSGYLLPFPVRVSNLFLDYYPDFFSSYVEPKLGKIDIFHGTNYTVFPFQKCRKVMTIYDVTFLKYPEYVNSVVQQYGKRVKKCLQWTDLVITISESSKRDIVEYLNFDADRVWVTPLASRYAGEDGEWSNLEQPQVDYDFSRPYLLFVSTLEPRKNIVAIVEAFNYLKEKYRIEQQLVLIGQKGWKYKPIFDAIASSPYNNEIHHLNYLGDRDVAWFYQHADVFVYPSHYEGFGLPVLEAMTWGAPVVTSNTSSLPEVAGDAALQIDPNEPLELAEAILQILESSEFRQTLIAKGKAQAKRFSWENTAKETLAAYRYILS